MDKKEDETEDETLEVHGKHGIPVYPGKEWKQTAGWHRSPLSGNWERHFMTNCSCGVPLYRVEAVSPEDWEKYGARGR